MNKIHIKSHIPEGEDGFTLPSSESSVSVTILLLYSLPELSLATLPTTSRFHSSSNKGGPLQLFIWVASTEALNLNYPSGIPPDSIITSTYKATVFPFFSNTTTSRLLRSLPLTHFPWPHRHPDLIPVERREGTMNNKEWYGVQVQGYETWIILQYFQLNP